MKYLITILLLLSTTFSSYACRNKIPLNVVESYISGNPLPFPHECKDHPSFSCICYDHIDGWDVVELEDIMVVDFIRKEQETKCESEEDCQKQLELLKCESGSPIKNLEELSVYCAVEMLKKDGKKLINSEEKKAAREKKIKDEKDAHALKLADKQAAKERIDALDLSKTLTTKQLTDALKDVKLLLKD